LRENYHAYNPYEQVILLFIYRAGHSVGGRETTHTALYTPYLGIGTATATARSAPAISEKQREVQFYDFDLLVHSTAFCVVAVRKHASRHGRSAGFFFFCIFRVEATQTWSKQGHRRVHPHHTGHASGHENKERFLFVDGRPPTTAT
jgi:hypothetical protein